MKITLPPDFDLTRLAQVALDAPYANLLQLAMGTCGGSTMWQRRKKTEAHEVLAMAQVTRRIKVLALDLREVFRVHFLMRAPVACLPDPAADLRVDWCAQLGLCYPESAVVTPQPGFSFISLLFPAHAWHPNIAPMELGQRICLGPQLPSSTRVREIIFLTYHALTLAAVQFNPLDPAGVMNAPAAEWFQRNPDRIPLSKEPFFVPGADEPTTTLN